MPLSTSIIALLFVKDKIKKRLTKIIIEQKSFKNIAKIYKRIKIGE